MPKFESGSSAAVIDQPKRTATEIAAAAAEQAAGIQQTNRAKDIAAWRRVVSDIADGQEPDGAVLASIAILTARLDLPEGSLAMHVEAMQLEKSLVAIAEEAERVGKAAELEMEPLGNQVREAQQRLLELRNRADLNIIEQQNAVYQRIRLNDHRATHPIVFSQIDNLGRKAVQR